MRRRLTRGREGYVEFERADVTDGYIAGGRLIWKRPGGRGGGRRKDGHGKTTQEDSPRYRGDGMDEMPLVGRLAG